MKITNKYNLPDAIYNALKDVYRPDKKRLSITRLIDSPLIAHLLDKHWDELEEDASERLWALLGQSMDYILSKNAPKHWIVQEKLEHETNGIIVVGKIDYYDPETKTLGDWKSTSVWSYIFGGRSEWEKQLNCYDWLERHRGRRPEKLVAQRLFRDWTQRRSTGSDYPTIPFMSLSIDKWPEEKQETYIQSRLELHQSEPTECVSEEKWEKPTMWAVMKRDRKSALRVLNSLEDALDWCSKNGHTKTIETLVGATFQLKDNIKVTERRGEYVRCNSYCPVRTVCPYRNRSSKNANA